MSRTPKRQKQPGYEYWSRGTPRHATSPGKWSKNQKARASRREPIEMDERCPVAREKTNGSFYCSRDPGHSGPCAAHPDPKLREKLQAEVGKLLGQGHYMFYALRCVADSIPGMTVAALRCIIEPP